MDLMLVIISVWCSKIIFFSAVVAPTVFKTLEERDAGLFLRSFFPKYYNFGVMLGIIGLIVYFTASVYPANALLTLIIMTVLTVGGKLLIPVINNARDTYNESAFKKYHLLSVAMNVLTLIVGIIFIVFSI